MYTGPNIVRNGLVLHFDPANIKCFRGEPTVNYVVLASTMGNCGSYSNDMIEYYHKQKLLQSIIIKNQGIYNGIFSRK